MEPARLVLAVLGAPGGMLCTLLDHIVRRLVPKSLMRWRTQRRWWDINAPLIRLCPSTRKKKGRFYESCIKKERVFTSKARWIIKANCASFGSCLAVAEGTCVLLGVLQCNLQPILCGGPIVCGYYISSAGTCTSSKVFLALICVLRCLAYWTSVNRSSIIWVKSN